MLDVFSGLLLHHLQPHFLELVALILLIQATKVQELLLGESGVENGELLHTHALFWCEVVPVILSLRGWHDALYKGAVRDAVACLLVFEKLLSRDGVLGERCAVGLAHRFTDFCFPRCPPFFLPRVCVGLTQRSPCLPRDDDARL
ncbi:hypothetical protein, conserved [Leishmania tarentolae]|uniref:Uncharacterized protein n=1 Tax=Leishmania tarentolae TaxID=5689 RepID=A0A640KX93_LEITA|nr:hypothetical protein, conserved [Leishmania tarentolae]